MSQVKLYEQFNRCWYNGGVIWVISDTHFNDSDCKLMDPNWISVDEQVKLINSCVGKNDTLIILGDVGDIEPVRKLKGYKVLVMGNHDKGASNYRRAYNIDIVPDEYGLFYFKKVDDNKLFDEVYEGPIFINDKILLSHEPVELAFGYNIHGHNHSGQHKVIKDNKASINVAANIIGYTPIRLDKLIEGIKVKDLHRITVDYATENSLVKR